MARLGRGGFLALAVIFHLVYIYSIFDIYFVSPVVHGMQAYRVQQDKAPAKRLVLYVGDGLRADKAFQSFPDPSPRDPAKADLTPRPLAPFLRSRVLEHGTFGVSHTRVPTESRPGHVALIAGLYEDVSAVTTGWKLNPVDFDSVFNRSRHTWSWGSPDILHMFAEGAVPGRVDAESYPPEYEDFTLDATALDTWVFDKVRDLFKEAKTNSTLDNILRQDKNVFFLHLLGLDTSGHAYRPYSKEYLHNIKIVDDGVKEITGIIEDFFRDDQTAFIFTADHGMSDWGSHGDGHPDNTRTPLIAWGSGIARPNVFPKGNAPGHDDGFSHDWNLNHIQRHDVAQADIATLMAYLTGLEFPVNSVGELPLSFLTASPAEKANAALVNTKSVLEMYRVKEVEKKATALNYKPYPPFGKVNGSIAERLSAIQTSISSERHEEAIDLSAELLQDGIQGLRYLQTYDWLFLRALITAGYLGWITYALSTVIDLHVLQGSVASERTLTTTMIFSSILVLLYASFIIDRSPLTYYGYAFFPVFFWEEIFSRRKGCLAGLKVLFGEFEGSSGYGSLAIQFCLYIGVLEALVQSYFHRSIFTVCYVLAAIWPFQYGADFIRDNTNTLIAWAAGCLVLSTFTLLEALKVENANTITTGGILMFAAGAVYLVYEHDITSRSRSKTSASKATYLSRAIMGLQVGIILLSVLVTRSSVISIQSKNGLPLGNQVIGWFAMVASVVLPVLHRLAPNHHYLHRLFVIFLAFSPCFIILSISYEGLFYFTFCATLLTWVRLEHAIHEHHSTAASSQPTSNSPMNGTVINSITPQSADIMSRRTYRTLSLADLRTSLFFLFLLQSAFFSTGNIASVSSFSLDAVYRLIPVFDPFSQGALLMYKLMVPFAIISAALGILNRRLGLQSSALFMVVMSISDVMTLNFFWMVKDEGSWLDIGTTISHFVIASLIGVFVAGLEGVSEILIKGVEMDEAETFEGAVRGGGVEVVGNGDAKKMKGKGKTKVADERPVID